MLLTATLALPLSGPFEALHPVRLRRRRRDGGGCTKATTRPPASTEREQATPVTARRQRQAAQGERPSTGSRQLRRASRHFSTSWMPPRARRQGRVQVWASTTTVHVARDVRVSIVCRGCEPEDPAQNSCFSHETDGFLVSDFRIFRELEFCTVQNSRKA